MVDQAAEAAATPAARLVLVLAAMHAARTKAIRELLLPDRLHLAAVFGLDPPGTSSRAAARCGC